MSTTAEPTTTIYHFVMTLRWENQTNSGQFTRTGTCVLSAGATRTEVFQQIYDGAAAYGADQGAHGSPTVVFFALEPEHL